MPSHSTLRLLRRLLGASRRAEGPFAGSVTVLDGGSAVAVTEAAIAEAAGLGGSFPATGAELAWRAEQRDQGANLFGQPLASLAAEGPRGALAAAVGLALAGARATAFLSGPDLAAVRDLLQAAAGRRLPLVLHLAARALPGQAPAAGDGHEALHLAADSGCLLLVAANAQEAVDFTLIARRAAEQSLTPALVVMDGERTARSPQDVRLPPPGLPERFLGDPDDEIRCPTPAQELLFGEYRRRLPRWHDPDRPVLLGGLQSEEVWGLGRAAGEPFLDAFAGTALEKSFADFAAETGREHRAVSQHRLEGARLVLVVQGSAVETAEAVADHLRNEARLKVGVLGMRCLRPFPGAAVAGLLAGAPLVCVLERLETPLAGEPPLLRELRAALDRASENGRFGADLHAGYPALSERQRPRFLSVVYGLGGLPLRAADLIELCRRAEGIRRPRVYLGLDFGGGPTPYPKRQVLLERIRRSYPGIADLGLRSDVPGPALIPPGSLTIGVHRLSGDAGEGLAGDLAALMQRVLGGGVRGRLGSASAGWGAAVLDLVNVGSAAMRDPGDQPPVDLEILTVDPALAPSGLADGLSAGGAILAASALPDEALWARLPAQVRQAVKASGCGLYRLPPSESPGGDGTERLLGGVCSVLLDSGRLDLGERRLLSLREALLAGNEGAEQRLKEFRSGLAGVHRIDPVTLPGGASPRGPDDTGEVPALLRRLGGAGDAYDNLPRFWDQVGVLYRDGDEGALTPDPYLAVGAMPALSARLRDLSPVRRELPAFDPGLCTGCGRCWSGCPDGAVLAAAIMPERLIEAGVKAAGAHALRPVVPQLAAGMSRLCRQGESPSGTLGDLLLSAYEAIEAKLPSGERKAAIRGALGAVTDAVGCLPLARTEPFFGDSKGAGKDGELLALALDPRACKGCGICAQVCTDGALRMRSQDAALLARAREIQSAWDLLPGTSAATIARVGSHPAVGGGAAGLLSEAAARSLAGGDGSEPGSGARLALRLALATAESLQAPRLDAYAREVRDTAERVRALIRDLLANALPSDDLDALSRGLEGMGAGQSDLGAVIGQAEDALGAGVDAPRLRRLVGLARDLSDLASRLGEGRQGLGRARSSLVLSGWTGMAFPHNPFTGPVMLDPAGDGALLAAGLAEGTLRRIASELALLRKARLELEQPAEAARRWAELECLGWHDLDADERRRCPPLLLVGDGGLLTGLGLGQLASLLGGDLPVKVLVLADLDLGIAAPPELAAPAGRRPGPKGRGRPASPVPARRLHRPDRAGRPRAYERDLGASPEP